MRLIRPNSAVLAIALLAPLFAVACGTTYTATPPEPPRADLEGNRYERMRVLSGRLVDRLQATRDELRATRNREADTPVLADLLDRARRFRDRMENAADPPRYVRADVGEIDRLAREYDDETRNIPASTRASESWAASRDLINRMERLVSGEDVDLPPVTEVPPYPPNPSYPYPSTPTFPADPSYGSVLAGSALEDVRRMAHELAVRATLARDNAERAGTPSGDSDRRLLADLSYFVSGAKELETRTNSAAGVDRRDVRPFVDRLGEDARRLEGSLRSSTAFSRAGSDWDEVIRLIQRLSDATR